MKSPVYKDPARSVKERVENLIGLMTPEEKAAQTQCHWLTKNESLLDEQGNFDMKKANEYFNAGHGLGQVGRLSDSGGGKNAREMTELTNHVQKFFLENSRLGIPAIFHEECLHGLAAVDATSFPQPIAMACTFNTGLIEKVFGIIAREARARGAHQALAPVLDVAREPRWGRVEETFGEDPFLVSRMGLSAVKGFQGNGLFNKKEHLIATLKHYVGHGQPESGTNCAPVNISERVLRETFLYPFKISVEEGNISIMASYNEIDGVPSHANTWLLRDVLRNEWNFKGFVVADYYAIRELYDRPGLFGHNVAVSQADAARLAIEAGVNIELPEPDCYTFLPELLKEGKITEKQLDELLYPMLEYKFKLGLFDDPYSDPAAAEEISGCELHRETALQAARESIVLLQNKKNSTPLGNIRSIAIIGPNADRVMLGGYSGIPKHYVSFREGIEKEAQKRGIKTYFSEGCKITIGGSWKEDHVELSRPEEDRIAIQKAVATAEKADVVVLALGGNEQTSREAWDINHKGDRTSLQMVGLQDELVDALAKLKKPLIVFLFNGRPLSVTNLVEKTDVLFECFYLGQETGRAVAEVLFGDYNPGGKLSISIPRSVGHIPCYYNYRPSARRHYLFDKVSPLFSFGHGLSYTQFEFGKPMLNKTKMKADETTELSVNITNTGPVPGDEVVQLYIRDEFSSITRPVKELKGFRRIHLNPGETKEVKFEIDFDKLAFYNIDYKYTVEPGNFRLMVGNSSDDKKMQSIVLTVV